MMSKHSDDTTTDAFDEIVKKIRRLHNEGKEGKKLEVFSKSFSFEYSYCS